MATVPVPKIVRPQSGRERLRAYLDAIKATADTSEAELFPHRGLSLDTTRVYLSEELQGTKWQAHVRHAGDGTHYLVWTTYRVAGAGRLTAQEAAEIEAAWEAMERWRREPHEFAGQAVECEKCQWPRRHRVHGWRLPFDPSSVEDAA